MVLEILFWILLILSIISSFLPDTSPTVVKSRSVVILILLTILGLRVFEHLLSR